MKIPTRKERLLSKGNSSQAAEKLGLHSLSGLTEFEADEAIAVETGRPRPVFLHFPSTPQQRSTPSFGVILFAGMSPHWSQECVLSR